MTGLSIKCFQRWHSFYLEMYLWKRVYLHYRYWYVYIPAPFSVNRLLVSTKLSKGLIQRPFLLISCCHIVRTVFCNFSVCYCLVCILSKWPINGLPKSPDCPEPILHVCFLWTTPLLLADQLPHGSPDMILCIRRRHWKEELGMATKLSTTEKWAAIPLFKASSQLSSSRSYICVFSRY